MVKRAKSPKLISKTPKQKATKKAPAKKKAAPKKKATTKKKAPTKRAAPGNAKVQLKKRDAMLKEAASLPDGVPKDWAETHQKHYGNNFWMFRSSHGRNPIFKDPQQLLDACCEYFEWVEANPLWESKATHYQGVRVDLPQAKMRMMTKYGLCIFLGISRRTWENYKNDEDFLAITEIVEDVITAQRLEGAASELLNATIVARIEHLIDKSEMGLGNAGDEPFRQKIESDMDAKTAAMIYRETLRGLQKS